MAVKHPFEDDKPKGSHPFDDLPNIEEFEKTNETEKIIEKIKELPKKTETEQPSLISIEKPAHNPRDEAIANQLINMQFPTTIFFRPAFDYRKPYHILNILEAEFIEIIKYKPPDAFWCNFALDLLEFMHNNCPELRDKLQYITPVITKIPKADDKQQYIKEYLLETFRTLLK
jgi:hypothetical protein